MRGKIALVLFISLGLVFSTALPGSAQDGDLRRELRDLKESLRSGPLSKIDFQLRSLSTSRRGRAARQVLPVPDIASINPYMRVRGDYVTVDAVASGEAAVLLADLEDLGLEAGAVSGRMVSGELPISVVDATGALASLKFIRPALAKVHVGLTDTQGDAAQYTDIVRDFFGLDGSGVTVGVLSDSYDCGVSLGGAPFTTAADDVASGDLPEGIDVLAEGAAVCPDSSLIDEGRAMMQIIHDVAPGATQAFYSAFDGQASFANGIIALAEEAGADVIVDDVIYFGEPMFQDGIIAQAVDTVKRRGVAYFSSAGNQARDSYESAYEDSGIPGASGILHDFDPGPGVDPVQSFTIDSGDFAIFSFHWDQPYFSVSGAPGSMSDLDIVFYDTGGVPIPFCDDSFTFTCQYPGIYPNIGDDPYEVAAVFNAGGPLTVQVGLELFDGPAPGLMKYVFYGAGSTSPQEYLTASSTTYGHANAAGAEAVGAAAWFNTARFNDNPACDPACLNSFSSAGGTPILFSRSGRRLWRPRVRRKPELVGPDGGNTTFFAYDLSFAVPGTDEPDGFPNFFGTSASAPHVAGLAALMLEANDRLKPRLLYKLMERTAADMDDPATPEFDKGFDFGTGYGFVRGPYAVLAAALVGKKYQICHRPPGKHGKAKTLLLPLSAWPAHRNKGDKFGPCPSEDGGKHGRR
jgi:subtilisin family serine protease